MIKRYLKGQTNKISENFWSHEFDCRCLYRECIYTLIDTDLVVALESLRTKTGPLDLDCGFRCSRHNDEIGGKPGSFHMLGKAADIVTPLSSEETACLAEQLSAFKNGGIGRYPSFTHVDVRGYRARWVGPSK